MSMVTRLLLLLYFVFVINEHVVVVCEPSTRVCEPIRIELCRGLGYNMTAMPNLGGNELQQEAEYYLTTFSPLIQFGCSSQLKLFLCSVYVPMCTDKVANPIGPCRGLCESVQSRCFPVLQSFGFHWPEALDCAQFPKENNHVHMCMEGPRDVQIEKVPNLDQNGANGGGEHDCPPTFRRNVDSDVCVPICADDFLFDAADKKFAEVWVTVWALICLVSSIGATLTLCIGGGRVRARPLMSLAFCYCFVSAGWTIRIIAGRSQTTCHLNGEIRSEDGLGNVNCTFAFLLIYYFGMAANAWWVSLCVWWLAKAALGWSPERLRNLASTLHVCAWGLPAAQTVAALVRRDVAADELTGTCYVGNKNTTTFLLLVLIPQAIYLILGTIILLVGCLKMLTLQHSSYKHPSQQQTVIATRKKDSDVLGALATLYLIPILCTLAILSYEYQNRADWQQGRDKPPVWVYLLKYLMSFFIGVSTLLWLWSMKTVKAWKGLLKRCGPRKPFKAVKCQTLPLRYIPQTQHSHLASTVSTTLSTASRHSVGRHCSSHTRKPRIHHSRPASENIV